MPHRNQRQLTQLLSNNNSTLSSRSIYNSGNNSGYPSVSSGTGSSILAVTPLSSQLAASAAAGGGPPLITDTLTACLDVNGTYVCSSYSPRCYIIQKVTPNSVTVTPAASAAVSGPPPGFSSRSGQAGSSGSHHSINSRGGLARYNQSEWSFPLPGVSTASSSPYNTTHQQQHYHGSGSSVKGGVGSSSSFQHRPSFRTPQQRTEFEKTASSSSGRVYMNGEIGSSVGPVSETGIPTMVYPQPVTALSAPQPGTHFNSHSLNGVIMSQEPFGIAGEGADGAGDVDTLGKGRLFNSDQGQAQAQSGHTPDIPLEELKRMLLSQLEYYFSPENLASDKFLVSQMDSDHYVYISTLANFNMIKKLTSNIDLVTEVLRESKNVQVHADGKRVRPVSHRTVVILRGIPASTSADEIKVLFENENCPKCTGCEFAFNDSWYISFESDDDAMQAHRYLREDVREFKGQPIMARIKSKPTTLLSQGVAIGVPTIKNGYNQPGSVMQQFMASAPAFVPGNQPTGSNNPPTPLYTPGQPVPSVFSLPANAYAGFNPWAGYYDINSGGLAPIYPVNGLQPQASPGYPKSAQMNPRPRNLNPMRGVGPRRTMSSSSDSQNNVVGISNSNTANSNNSNGQTPLSSSQHQQQNQQQQAQQQQSYNSQQQQQQSVVRKSGGAPPAQPLLGMAPPQQSQQQTNNSLVSHQPQGGTGGGTHSSNHHHHSTHQVSSLPQQNVATTNTVTSNGRHYNNSYSQSVPHTPVDNYHYSSSSRPYRGGGDSRPRSSLSNRRGVPRRDEEGSYEYTPSSSSALNAPSSYRGNPSTRGGTVPPAALSPQIPPQVCVNNQNHQINLDLEGSAFPPLPGSANSSSKNGDSPYEGRLSDVVKGVKNMRVAAGSSHEKDDLHSGEIVVSAADPGSGNSPSGEVVVSAASPTDEGGIMGMSTSSRRDSEHHSSHTHSSANKKEYREIGVGGADENHDIRSSQSRNSVVNVSRQTADKSTRTDENLLNGDQSSGGSSSSSSNRNSQTSGNGGYRKSVVSQGGGSKSPIPAKRGGVGPFQQQQGGPSEVPYSSSRSLTSPISSSPSPANKPPFVVPGGSSSGLSGGGAGNSGRGANTSNVAKTTHHLDNNGRSGGGGGAAANGAGPVTSASSSTPSSHLNTNDKDAFPIIPNFVKSAVPSPTSTAKPFSGLTDHLPKETIRSEEERKESGQGDCKKTEDCSTESDRDGPVRLSYAQVAQSRKDAAATTVAAGQASPSSSTTNVTNQQGSSSQTSNTQSTNTQVVQDDKKQRGARDTKDNRAQSRPQRGNGDRERDRERDRDRDSNRGYRNRGFRSRVTSDNSDAGSNAGGSGRPPRGPRSPK